MGELKVADRDVYEEPNKSNAGSNYMTIIYYLLMAILSLSLFSLHFDDFQLEFSFCTMFLRWLNMCVYARESRISTERI